MPMKINDARADMVLALLALRPIGALVVRPASMDYRQAEDDKML
jgi:hypothetical protein